MNHNTPSTFHSIGTLASLALLALLLPAGVQAQSSWVSGNSGSYQEATNWSPSGVPASTATLNFSNASITPLSTITFDSDATAARTDFRGGEFVIQTGANTWNLTNGWQIGSAGVTSQSNRVTIDGGTVNSSSYTYLGSGSNDHNNLLLLTNGATVNFGSFNNRIGSAGNSNQVTVAGGSVLTSGAGGVTIGTGAGSVANNTGNTLLVTGANSVFNSGATVIVGSGVSAHGNRLTVSDGGRVIITNATPGSAILNLGNGAGRYNNHVLVDGAGSVIDVYGNQVIIHGGNFGANTITLTNGGTLNASNAVLVNDTTGGTINALIVNGGSATFAAVSLGNTNRLEVHNGTLNISGVLTNNVSGGGRAIFTGGTITSGGALFTNTRSFTVGDSNSATIATYQMNGGTHDFGAGLTVASDGVLTGTGTVVGAVNIAGTLAIGNSPGTMTFEQNLTLDLNSTSIFEINGFTGGQFDLAQGGAGTQAVTFGGTLELVFSGGFNTLGSVKIFDFENYGSNFSSVNSSGLAAGYTATFNQLDGMVTVVPEPSTYALLALSAAGLAAHVARRRRRS